MLIMLKSNSHLFCFQNQDSDAAKAFLEVAGGIDDIPFAITGADAVFSEYKIDGEAVVVLKNVSCARHSVITMCALTVNNDVLVVKGSIFVFSR